MAPGAVSQSAYGRQAAEQQHGLLGMLKNPYVFMTCAFASIGCIMYGYDQGVMSSVLVMENFQADFPDLMGNSIQGWLVSALELGAWAGALFTGWLSDVISRKYSMMVAVIIFTVGTCLQCAATKGAELFAGRVIGGFGIGMFSMVIPLYQAEIAPPHIRGGLISLQQLSITIGTAIAFWLDCKLLPKTSPELPLTSFRRYALRWWHSLQAGWCSRERLVPFRWHFQLQCRPRSRLHWREGGLLALPSSFPASLCLDPFLRNVLPAIFSALVGYEAPR